MTTARENLYRLIDQLPEAAIQKIERLLQVVVADFINENPKDDVTARITKMLAEAPEDDEPLTVEDLADIKEAKDSIARGEGITLEEMKRELGL